MIVKDARCIAIYGARGFGKTTLTQNLTAPCARKIVFDPLGQYAREFGWPMVGDIRALHRRVAQHWHHGFRIAYTVGGNFERELHRLSVYLWGAQEPYERSADDRKVALIVEEMNLSYPVAALPKDCRGVEQLTLQGRHRGIEIFGVTQRPALVSANFRAMVPEVYCFFLGFDDDRRALGRTHAAAIATLPKHHYLHLEGGVATRGQNPPIRHGKPPRVQAPLAS